MPSQQPPQPPSQPSTAAAQPPGQPPRRSRRSAIAGAVIALAAMGGLGWLAWHLTHPAAGDKAAMAGPGGAGGPGGPGGPGGRRGGGATTVGVATAELADLPVTLDALGTVTAAATTTVRPQVSGILQKVLYKEGQMVRAGQVLAQIDPRQFEMALMQATGQRQRDEAQLENARLTLERYRTLLAQDSIARQDVDTQAALVKQLEGTVTTDKASEGSARLNLGYTKVLAPISGRVGLRVVDIGNLVSSGDANGIAVITQLAPIDVEFAIPQDRGPEIMAAVNAGDLPAASAFDRTRTKELEKGRFSALDNQVDTQTGTIKAKARFSNTDNALFPSQFVNVRLALRTIRDAVMVPVTALRHGADGDYVWVLQPDRTVAMRAVTRGQATADKVQIATGLKAGEKVITEGADRLKDGARVMLPGDRPQQGRGDGQGRHGKRGQDGAQGGAGDGAPQGNGRQHGVGDGAAPQAGAGAAAAGTDGAGAAGASPAGGQGGGWQGRGEQGAGEGRRHGRHRDGAADGQGAQGGPGGSPAGAPAGEPRHWERGGSGPARAASGPAQ